MVHMPADSNAHRWDPNDELPSLAGTPWDRQIPARFPLNSPIDDSLFVDGQCGVCIFLAASYVT